MFDSLVLSYTKNRVLCRCFESITSLVYSLSAAAVPVSPSLTSSEGYSSLPALSCWACCRVWRQACLCGGFYWQGSLRKQIFTLISLRHLGPATIKMPQNEGGGKIRKTKKKKKKEWGREREKEVGRQGWLVKVRLLKLGYTVIHSKNSSSKDTLYIISLPDKGLVD